MKMKHTTMKPKQFIDDMINTIGRDETINIIDATIKSLKASNPDVNISDEEWIIYITEAYAFRKETLGNIDNVYLEPIF